MAKKLTLSLEFEIGQTVYLKTDTEQYQRLITGLLIHENSILYQVACGEEMSEHFGFELADSEDVMKRLK